MSDEKEKVPIQQREKSYYEYTRTEIRDMIPPGIERVLEIGCGTGNTLIWLRDIRRCSWIAGVEISAPAADIARRKLDAVYEVNVENSILPIPDDSLDLILCLDVLEHLIDPWSVLKRLQKLLKPGGALIASLPNVRNRKVLFPLLFSGRWDYTVEGILDKSHLRFFVRRTAVELIASSGLRVDMVLSTGLGHSRKSKIVNAMIPSFLTSLFEKQYLIRGIRDSV